MKKGFKKVLSVLLAVLMLASVAAVFAACSNEKGFTIAVEKGSAGEAEAKNLTDNVISLSTQSDALKEVKAGTADACIIDSTMANAMTADGTDFDNLGYAIKLTTEQYGIGFRQGSDLTAKVNALIDELRADGTLAALSDKYGVNIAAATQSEAKEATVEDYQKILDKGEIVVGITNYEPMDYKAEDGSWTGFDAEFAQAVAAKMGVTVKFVEINWDNKFTELKSGAIDCIWNGMTISDSVIANCDISVPYAENSQVIVMNEDKLADYPDVQSIKPEEK